MTTICAGQESQANALASKRMYNNLPHGTRAFHTLALLELLGGRSAPGSVLLANILVLGQCGRGIRGRPEGDDFVLCTRECITSLDDLGVARALDEVLEHASLVRHDDFWHAELRRRLRTLGYALAAQGLTAATVDVRSTIRDSYRYERQTLRIVS